MWRLKAKAKNKNKDKDGDKEKDTRQKQKKHNSRQKKHNSIKSIRPHSNDVDTTSGELLVMWIGPHSFSLLNPCKSK